MNSPRIAFRVDASTAIGTGHVMRCVTLAMALKARGATVRFLARHMLPHLHQMLTDHGCPCVLIDDDGRTSAGTDGTLAHSDWLGVTQEADARATRRALSDAHWDWLVVDHYALDTNWEQLLRPQVGKILVLDDLADRRHDCDVLLDQNFHQDAQSRYLRRVAPDCRCLLGPRYALLRDEFRALRAGVSVRSGLVRRILVFFGGVDAANLTGRVIDALARASVTGVAVDVVVGAQHPARATIAADCTRHGYVCHVQTAHMAALMAQADVAIGAGGTAVWERLCMGLPAVALCTAQNQAGMIDALASAGYLWGVLGGFDAGHESLDALVHCACMGGPLWRGFSERGMELVDGAGVSRVVRHMLAPVFVFRRATLEDTDLLFAWRNHPVIRAASHQSGALDVAAHAIWVARTLADGSRCLLIAQVGGEPMAVLRFDFQGREAVISVYLSPFHLHEGLGPILLVQAHDWLLQQELPVRRVVAHVRANNPSSLQSFRNAGYVDEMQTLVFDLERI